MRRPISRERDDPTREHRPEPPPAVHPLLALQSAIGNHAVARYVDTRRAEETTDGQPLAPYYAWTKEEIRPIQRELKRLRLYKLGLDGILGKGSEMGLVEAFGGDEWRNLDAATVLTRLTAAQRPKTGAGHDLRYGELFKDGLLDLTFGYGFMEELSPDQWAQYAQDIEDALKARGYSEDAKRAAELYHAAGRQNATGFGRFFVKEIALNYSPPAGPARPIPAIVRFIMNPGGDKGVEARQAFEEGMTQGDAAYYSGHGRYGSGPDFDRNFGKFTLLDENGKVEQVIDDYEVLGGVLAKEHGGGAWARFLWRWDHNRIQVDFSNAGNLRLNAKNKHPEEFGGKLINWAMDQTGQTAATGPGGELATQAAANPDRKYRVLVFDGCRTQDYEGAIRKTEGFDTKSADVIETRRTVGFGAEAEAFCAFLDGLVGQQSAEDVVKGMNEEMKGNEEGYAGAPYVGSGFGDNLSR